LAQPSIDFSPLFQFQMQCEVGMVTPFTASGLLWALIIGLHLALLVGWRMMGLAEAVLFAVVTAVLWATWKWKAFYRQHFTFSVGSAKRSDDDDMSSKKGTVTSGNMAAVTAYLNTDPFLVPFGRALFLPVRSSVLTFLLVCGVSIIPKAVLIVLWQLASARVGRAIPRIELQMGQRRRDLAATRLLTSVLEGAALGSYFIYLRPFAITGTIHAEDPGTLERATKHKFTRHVKFNDGSEYLKIPLFTVQLPLVGDVYGPVEENPEWEAVLEKAYRLFGKSSRWAVAERRLVRPELKRLIATGSARSKPYPDRRRDFSLFRRRILAHFGSFKH
jgi:hypothetical protein